ncbi:DUF1573 domain-containing protein [Flavobacterium sp.]|jgi:protein disulfide-isomerase|uniref:DUF1573 domain-containing protein n=1 Tax=Flavobacterium sp. TaxID=239 RepID=UPI00344D4EF8
MKKIFITLLVVISLMKIQAQEKLTWHTNIDEAIALSKAENKPLFLFFTGSDWNGWSTRLQNEVFNTPEFIAWARGKVILVELDFPRRTAQSDDLKIQNNKLQQFFQVIGYPTVWFAKPGVIIDGKTNFERLGETKYVAGGPLVWLEKANQIVAKYQVDGVGLSFESEVIDYGTISHNADGNREFVFVNNGNKPLLIEKTQGSCSCIITKNPEGEIAPGAKGKIKIHYATDRVGNFTKTITVWSNATNQTTKVLTIKGNVLPAESEKSEVASKNITQKQIIKTETSKEKQNSPISSSQSDFGINEITFSYTGNPANKKFSDGYIEKQKILSTIGYACNKFIIDVDTTNQMSYKKELKRLSVLVDKKLMIPKLNIIKIFFSNVKEASIEYKTSADIYKTLAELYYLKPSKNSWGNPFTTLPIKIQKYETDEEIETGKRESARIQQEYESKTKPEGSIRKYCVYTYKGKYEISLLDNKTFIGYYKLYDNQNNLIKTVQGRWTLRDEGVYGSAYRLTFDFTGANSNLPSMKFTCQYDGSGQLQALIDNQDRTWDLCR